MKFKINVTYNCVHAYSVTQLCMTLCNTIDCRLWLSFPLQGIFPTQGSNPRLLCLLHWQADSLPLGYLGRPVTYN